MSSAGDGLAASTASSATPAASPVRVALVAGEASGDLLGAGLMQRLAERLPGATFAGVGGEAMRAAGLQAWHDSSALSVMGLSEVLAHLPRLLMLRRGLRHQLLAWRPDVFIGIDAPDFTLGVERWLKRRGVRTVHYVSPSVWAWRQKRAAGIGRSADRVLCLFPMEPAIYARHGVDARFVGHPFADEMALDPDRETARRDLGVATGARVLALLPGSRLGEIARLGDAFFGAAARIVAAMPDVDIIVPAASAACRDAIVAQLARHPAAAARVRVIDGRARGAMVAADVVLLASGTATLEAMLAKRPMVVGYRISPTTHAVVKGLGMLKVDRYALPNVLAGEDLVPELMQDRCTAEALAAAVLHWFEDPAAVATLLPKFRELHLALRRDAAASAASAVVELLQAPAAGAGPLRAD